MFLVFYTRLIGAALWANVEAYKYETCCGPQVDTCDKWEPCIWAKRVLLGGLLAGLICNFPIVVLQVAFLSIWPADLAIWRALVQVCNEFFIVKILYGTVGIIVYYSCCAIYGNESYIGQ